VVIDIDELPQVINYDIPEIPETYVHRIGRTAVQVQKVRRSPFATADEMDDLRTFKTQ